MPHPTSRTRTPAPRTQPATRSVFDLPAHSPKNDPALIADDERHFAALAATLERSITDLARRLDLARRTPADLGHDVLERDGEIRRLATALRTLRRYGLDLCLGYLIPADDERPVHIGRVGLLGPDGEQLLLDWRSPAAAPFFGATHADPMGLVRRRRYRWSRGRVTDFWDEIFTDAELERAGACGRAALDDQSAFIASLSGSRSARMRDVLGTIAADQDAIIRAPGSGTLVVDGGPGTGKTVVALHRAAFLLYADPRVGRHRGGVLVVGPHDPYLAYVGDVLPGLGEEGVQLCTPADLVAEGADAGTEPDPRVAALKADLRMVDTIEAAVRFYEQPPAAALEVATDWGEVTVTVDAWAEAFAAPEPGTPHNEAREQIWGVLLEILELRLDADAPRAAVHRALRADSDLRAALEGAWVLIEAADLVADLWAVPAYLRSCAGHLTAAEAVLLRRTDRAWTTADLPLLDAARHRLGDPDTERIRRRRTAAAAEQRRRMDDVVDELVSSVEYDDGEGLMVMFRSADLRDNLADDAALPTPDPDRLAGPFTHIVVDEAQELTDAQWRMLTRRCPSGSLTVVGDRAQARRGFTESWTDRLHRVGLDRVTTAGLTVNYRTPEEVMAVAEPVIRAALPDANVPTSIRASGIPVRRGTVGELDGVLDAWLTGHAEGTACVIGGRPARPRPRVRTLTPELAKGLEFDLVVLVNPGDFGAGAEPIAGSVDRYVSMTRATGELVILGS